MNRQAKRSLMLGKTKIVKTENDLSIVKVDKKPVTNAKIRTYKVFFAKENKYKRIPRKTFDELPMHSKQIIRYVNGTIERIIL
jgi:hypothetical protein